MVGRWVWAAVAGLLLAGCLASAPNEDAADESPAGLVATVADVPGTRTTATAAQWATGEWWQYRVADTFGNVYEVKRVVAGRDGSDYVVGMPRDEWNPEVIAFHLPGFGEVRAADLAYKVHNGYYNLLKFPLTAGESWEAFFEFGNVTVTVETVEAGKATIRVENPQSAADEAVAGQRFNAKATYDAELGEIGKLDVEGYGSIEVTDHGLGWTGIVRSPRDQAFAIYATGGVITQGDDPVNEQVVVEDGHDAMVLVLGVGARSAAGQVPPAVCRETATAPDRTVYQVTKGPLDAAADFTKFEVERPAGTWTFEHLRAGYCLTQSEGFAYEVHDIELPGLAVTRPIA